MDSKSHLAISAILFKHRCGYTGCFFFQINNPYTLYGGNFMLYSAYIVCALLLQTNKASLMQQDLS